MLDEDQASSIAVPAPPSSTSIPDSSSRKGMGLAQQEKEFQKAVQPGSPISALLSSARQPLMVAPVNFGSVGRGEREQPLIRKLQAAKEGRSPGRPRALQGIAEQGEEEAKEAKIEEQRKKELESQKARIVAQMVPVPPSASDVGPGFGFGDEDQENVPPIREIHLKDKEKVRAKAKEVRDDHAGLVPTSSTVPLKVNGFDAAAQTLIAAFEAKALGRLFKDPREDADLPDPKVFIVSWVDYCNKYGMGYALTDGSVGVHFNDSTTIVLSPDKQ